MVHELPGYLLLTVLRHHGEGDTSCIGVERFWGLPEGIFVNPNYSTQLFTKIFVGGCLDPPVLCCGGTNHSCKRDTCYCDEVCVSLTDCCSDYLSVCKVCTPLHSVHEPLCSSILLSPLPHTLVGSHSYTERWTNPLYLKV